MGEQGLPFAFGNRSRVLFRIQRCSRGGHPQSESSAHPSSDNPRGNGAPRYLTELRRLVERQRVRIVSGDDLRSETGVFDSPVRVTQYRLTLVRFSLASALREVIIHGYRRLNEIEQFAVRLRI